MSRGASVREGSASTRTLMHRIARASWRSGTDRTETPAIRRALAYFDGVAMVRVRHDPEHTPVGYEFALAVRRRRQRQMDLLRARVGYGDDPAPLRRAALKLALAEARTKRTLP